jgi:hypothetical protein
MKNGISFQQLRTTHETEDSGTGVDNTGVDGPGRAEMPHR